MNKRIKELIKQATNPDYDSDDGPMNELNVEKFAELIVRECANMAESFHRNQYDFTGNLELHEFIKQHFGVEE